MSSARRARPADLGVIARTAAIAFVDDPLVRWLLPDLDAYRAGRGEHYFRIPALRLGADGEVWVTDDVVSLAMWRHPHPHALPQDAQQLVAEHLARFDDGERQRLAIVGAALGRVLPPQPFWYLGVLATHPDWRGRGLARLVMRDVARRADAEGLPMYLETATATNVAWYRRLGFHVRDELAVDDGCPTLWTMWREPGANTTAWS